MFKHRKIIALLNLTQSDNDNECLSAIRHANKLLKKENMDWNSLFDVAVEDEKKYERREGAHDVKVYTTDRDCLIIEQMLNYLSEVLYGSQRDFVESVGQQYYRNKKITIKQFEALKKFYQRRNK